MLGLGDLDTALVIAWFLLAMVWAFTTAYYDRQVSYYKGLWLDTEAYTENLMRLYRGELMIEFKAEADAQADAQRTKEIETGD